MTFKTLDAGDLSQKELYKLLIGCILPRPIGFVSTQSVEGQLNLAPFSFFTGVCSTPPTLLFCPTAKGPEGNEKKDTLANVEATGEFVVNVVSEPIVQPMVQTSAEYPLGVSEFLESGLTPSVSVKVKPPGVLESPIRMECILNQVVRVGEGPGSGNIVIGTIVYFHIREDLYDNGRVDTLKLQPVGRLAGASYTAVRDLFDIPRPSLPPQYAKTT